MANLLCRECVSSVIVSARKAGDSCLAISGSLRSKTSAASRWRPSPATPQGWLAHVEADILDNSTIIDRLALVRTDRGLEIRNGNHRAWIAYSNGIELRALVFKPVCGRCTEALFEDTLNAATRRLGWMYHQQGF